MFNNALVLVSAGSTVVVGSWTTGLKNAKSLPSQLSRHTQSQKKKISALNQSNQMTQSPCVFYHVVQLHLV